MKSFLILFFWSYFILLLNPSIFSFHMPLWTYFCWEFAPFSGWYSQHLCCLPALWIFDVSLTFSYHALFLCSSQGSLAALFFWPCLATGQRRTIYETPLSFTPLFICIWLFPIRADMCFPHVFWCMWKKNFIKSVTFLEIKAKICT